MLGRVRQFFRQYHRAAFIYITGRGPSHLSLLLLQPLQQRSRVRCTSVAAAQARISSHSPHHVEEEEEHAHPRSPAVVGSANRQKAWEHGPSNRQRTERPPQPARAVVSMVDSLFARWKAGVGSIEELCKAVQKPFLLSHLQDTDKARALAVLMVNTPVPQRAHRVLLLAYQLGCRFKQEAYEAVAFQLAETHQWAHMNALVALGMRQTGRTSVRLLNWRARAFLEISHFSLLEDVLASFERGNLKPTRRTFHLLVSGHIRNRNLRRAREYLAKMEEAGFPVDASTHAIIVTAYRSLGPDRAVTSQALAAVPELEDSGGTTVLNSLVRLSLDAHDWHGALQVLSVFGQPLQEMHHSLSSGTATTQLDGDAAPQKPSRIFSPDVVTFHMLIDYMAELRDLPRALDVVKHMKAVGIQPDSTIVAALIKAHAAAGEISAAMSLAASTCQRMPSVRPFFRALGLDPADQGMPELVPTGLPPTVHIFNALLKGMLLHGPGVFRMRLIRRIMDIIGIEPDAETVATCLSYLGKTERLRPRELVRTLRSLPATIRPTLRLAHVILRSILRQEERLVRQRSWNATSARAKKQMCASSLSSDKISTVAESFDPTAGFRPPRTSSYGAMLQTLVNSLRSRKVRADRATIALRLKHDAVVKQDMEKAQGTYQTMLDRGMHPNEYHFAAMMEGYAEKGDMFAAEDVMESAIKAGTAPNAVLYTILIVGYARRGDPAQATRVFHHMISAGIQPDVASVDAVASAYFAVGAYALARRVLLELWIHVGPFPEELRDPSLSELAQAFRQMTPQPQRMTSQARRVLRWKLKSILKLWRDSFSRGARAARSSKVRQHVTQRKNPQRR